MTKSLRGWAARRGLEPGACAFLPCGVRLCPLVRACVGEQSPRATGIPADVSRCVCVSEGVPAAAVGLSAPSSISSPPPLLQLALGVLMATVAHPSTLGPTPSLAHWGQHWKESGSWGASRVGGVVGGETKWPFQPRRVAAGGAYSEFVSLEGAEKQNSPALWEPRKGSIWEPKGQVLREVQRRC